MKSLCLALSCATFVFGCAAAGPGPVAPVTPVVEAAPAEPAEETPPAREPATDEQSLLPAPDPRNLPPAHCQAYAHPSPEPGVVGTCPESRAELLDRALAITDSVARNAALSELERCTAWEPGFLVALRAHLAPVECADGLIEAWFAQPELRTKYGVRGDLVEALLGMNVAARLRRLDGAPPELPAPFDKAQFVEYFESTLKPWVVERAQAIQELSERGAQLSGYGRGVVAVEAGVADLRFVEMVREIELPKEMAEDPEVQQAYFGALDEALEPRKRRARDAALVGLEEFAESGALHSERVQRGREVLSRSYAGHRIDALDGLRLPPLPPLVTDTPELRVAAAMPPFLASEGVGAVDLDDAPMLRALLEQGFSSGLREQLDTAPLSDEVAALYARFWVLLGQRYFRCGDFTRAASLSQRALSTSGGPAPVTLSDAAQLIQGLAAALGTGPKDARAMIGGGPLLPASVGDVRVLDTLSAAPGQLGGLAAYDAAYVLALLPPIAEPRRFWNGIADRYELAAKKLDDRELAALAKTRATNARLTARAIVR